MFIGEYHHTIDDKSRLQIPAKWRAQLDGGAVLTKGFDGSLKCYPAVVWVKIAEKLAALPQADQIARAYVRQTLSGAVDVELDKLGRIILPSYLKTYSSLTRPVVLAGLSDHFELWDEKAWQLYINQADISGPQATTALSTIGI